jgi:hypothetical protein
MDGMFHVPAAMRGLGAIDAWTQDAERELAEAATLPAKRLAAETYGALRELRAAVLASMGVAAHG